jgi:hypothetical protein
VNKKPGDAGTVFNVDVTVENVVDLFGFDFNLTWDRNVIALTNVDFENMLNSVWGVGNWFLAKNQSDLGSYKLVALSTASGFNTSGTQSLMRLTFLVENTYGHDAQTAIHFEVAKLSDSAGHSITASVVDGSYVMNGVKPTLLWNSTDVACRKYFENFTVAINVTDVYDATDFQFEIHYNTTQLKYANITFTSWSSGSITLDEINGNLTGYTSGTPISGYQTLLTVTFQTACYHIWKKLPGWVNNLTSTIYVQRANLSYPTGPDLGYVRGGLNQINVGADVNYTFSPIQGDVDNNGIVDVFDIRTVAAYYDVKEGDPLWSEASQYDLTKPTTENLIDIYDMVVVATNYGFAYQ